MQVLHGVQPACYHSAACNHMRLMHLSVSGDVL